MKAKYLINVECLLSLTGAIGILTWWIMMPVFLPVTEAADNFQNMVLDDDWVAVNLVGLISLLLFTLGFPGYYIKHHTRFNRLGFIGLLVVSAGLMLYTSVQYYETLIWPAAVRVNPELLQVKGALVSGDPLVVAGLLVSGVVFGVGYILFGISALQTKSFPRLPLWFLIIGAPVFGNGVAFPVRTLGLLLFCTGIIWLAIKTRS